MSAADEERRGDGTIIDARALTPGSERGLRTRPERAPPSANPFDADPADFAAQIERRGQNYQSLVQWLAVHMVPNEDMVRTHFVRRDSCDFGGPGPKGNCTPEIEPGHWSAADLSKKGAEKVCGLLGLGTRYLGMSDFRQAALAGRKITDVVIDCELYTTGGETVSQGSGAATLEESGTLNNALKKACKRAHVDAVKKCAGLSGLATEIKSRMPAVDTQEAKRRAREAGLEMRAGRGGSSRHATGKRPPTCPIGKKHKDKRWSQIPSDYLRWIVSEVSDKPDVVMAAADELERRKAEGAAGHAVPEPGDSAPDEPPRRAMAASRATAAGGDDEGPPIPPAEAYDEEA